MKTLPSCLLGFSSCDFSWFWYNLLRHKLSYRYRFTAEIYFFNASKKVEFWVTLIHLLHYTSFFSCSGFVYGLCIQEQPWHLNNSFHCILNHSFSLLFLCVSSSFLLIRSSWISTETVKVVPSAFNLSSPHETSFKPAFVT